jgi:hypothetical protein
MILVLWVFYINSHFLCTKKLTSVCSFSQHEKEPTWTRKRAYVLKGKKREEKLFFFLFRPPLESLYSSRKEGSIAGAHHLVHAHKMTCYLVHAHKMFDEIFKKIFLFIKFLTMFYGFGYREKL